MFYTCDILERLGSHDPKDGEHDERDTMMVTSVVARVEEKLAAVRKSGRQPLRIELGQEEYRTLQEELSPIPGVAIPVLLGVRVTQVKSARRVAVVAGEKPVKTRVRSRRAASTAA